MPAAAAPEELVAAPVVLPVPLVVLLEELPVLESGKADRLALGALVAAAEGR